MQPIEIKPGITWVGVNDRKTELFEGMWNIGQEGISYNSYLIRDEKNVVIDLSKEMLTGTYLNQLQSLVELQKLDFVVINHMEPDHTGVLRSLINIAPKIQLLGTAKTRDMLREFYGITENIRVVTDGETLNLGHHTLRFINTPFVHWPETMMTYEESQKTLFSCDGFGLMGRGWQHVMILVCLLPGMKNRPALLYQYCCDISKPFANCRNLANCR